LAQSRDEANLPSVDQRLDFRGHQNDGRCVAFRALTNEMDWIAVKELISAGVIEENALRFVIRIALSRVGMPAKFEQTFFLYNKQ
jgi:hypothetical protein